MIHHHALPIFHLTSAVRMLALSCLFLLSFTQTLAAQIVSPLGLPSFQLAPNADHLLLRVVGSIGVTNAPEVALFDLQTLDALPQSQFETSTIWTDGINSFSGVLLADMLSFLEASGTKLEAVALNDYAAEIPISDAILGGPILATRMNGELMSIRDKGPIWIVYPYDDNPEYQTETIYARSVWQLIELRILE